VGSRLQGCQQASGVAGCRARPGCEQRWHHKAAAQTAASHAAQKQEEGPGSRPEATHSSPHGHHVAREPPRGVGLYASFSYQALPFCSLTPRCMAIDARESLALRAPRLCAPPSCQQGPQCCLQLQNTLQNLAAAAVPPCHAHASGPAPTRGGGHGEARQSASIASSPRRNCQHGLVRQVSGKVRALGQVRYWWGMTSNPAGCLDPLGKSGLWGKPAPAVTRALLVSWLNCTIRCVVVSLRARKDTCAPPELWACPPPTPARESIILLCKLHVPACSSITICTYTPDPTSWYTLNPVRRCPNSRLLKYGKAVQHRYTKEAAVPIRTEVSKRVNGMARWSSGCGPACHGQPLLSMITLTNAPGMGCLHSHVCATCTSTTITWWCSTA
jgi:hypothetical protein